MKLPCIYLLLDSRQNGGIESHVLQLSEGLKQFGQDVCVVFLTDYGPHPLREQLANKGINSITLDGSIVTLWRFLKAKPPTVIHTHGYKAGIYGRLVAKVIRIPVVTTYHAGEIPSGKLALFDWLDRVTAILAKKRFAVSPQILGRLPVKAQVFDNFISTDALTDSHGEEIAFVGRISEEKGPDYFVELAKRFPDISFHLYGDGPDMEKIRTTSPNNIYLHGQQNNMAMVWARIGLLVMPSRYEGLPMAALEAMGRGIPVIASNVGALDKVIHHQQNGWLVTPGDIEELSLRLTQWLNMSAIRKKVVKNSAKQQINSSFSSKVAIPKLIATYLNVSL